RGGLSEVQARRRRRSHGANEIAQDRPQSPLAHLWLCYRNPFNLLLSSLALVSWLTEDGKAGAAILIMVGLSTLMRFVQERRSCHAAERLKEMVSTTATVLRRDPPASALSASPSSASPAGHRVERPMRQLVPGDIVLLSAGDMIPADLRILGARDLFVSQAALTGESMPVEKFAEVGDAHGEDPLACENLCFMGTTVVSGSAQALVVGTGGMTYFGALAERVSAAERSPTAFQAGVNKVSWLLIRFMFLMAPLVFFINGFTKGSWSEAALFALSVAVGLTPEMLPMIATSTLAKGAVLLSRRKVIVKHLDAIQSLGAMSVLCTDKTGTLTQDRIALERYSGPYGEADEEVLRMAFLNSYYQTGLRNLLDVAVLEHGELHRNAELLASCRLVDEIPFDFSRRRMSVVIETGEPAHRLICKGALEEVLAACSKVRSAGEEVALTAERLARIGEVSGALNRDGLRVVAVAIRELSSTQQHYSVADETDLTLLGYVAFLDPPKETTAPALSALRVSGVAVKILTGDNAAVTQKVCRDVGLTVEGVLLGTAIEAMDDAALAEAAERSTVFAKLTPAHKERIVRTLRANGHVVGFMGDGINDAPALRAADIGISVDTAVDIAKEAADLILLEKSLLVLEAGVREGRRTFSNMLKYIRMTASSNFGNVFSVLIASAFLPFLPMLPLQLLVQNLLYDISQIAIPFDRVDEELLANPQHWNPDELSRFMLCFGPLSLIFDVATFAVLWFGFGADSVERQALFQSGWFVEGLMTQTLIVHVIRTRRMPFLQSRAAWPVLLMSMAVAATAALLPMGPWAAYFRFVALPHAYFAWLLVILVAYIVLAQGMKAYYARRYGWQ
ncbi:MAG TPA: magnesium-translocating P-type ATPase, partial [Rhodocyclaceae bacterium]|nr:magnesium-translocating P-type ATPase [Rhodocyclaceae bacterium]